MTPVFYAIGSVAVLAGAAWCFLVAGQPMTGTSMSVFAKLFAMAPGFGVVGSGMLFLAIGGVLSRLDKIVHSNADTADAMDVLAAWVKKQPT